MSTIFKVGVSGTSGSASSASGRLTGSFLEGSVRKTFNVGRFGVECGCMKVCS